jgi:putative ABC transport system permease protein
LVQPGVLDDAPKTMLASISRVNVEEKNGLMNRLNETFANITVLDVRSMVAQLEDLTGKLTRSLASMAALAVCAGLLALYAVVRQEARQREPEINLLRVLGAGPGRIRLLFALEFGLLGGAAATVAVALSSICSWVTAQLLFERIWSLQWIAALLLLAAACMISAGTALAVIQSVIRRKSVELLA